MAYIEIRNVTKSYGNQMVLNHVSVSWERGKIHGLIGRNGSGKTQLFKCLCGYVAPESGVICVDGQIIGQDRSYPQSMGLLIDGPGFLPDFSGLFNLQLLAVIRSALTTDALRACMQKVGLGQVGKKRYGQYSLGMKQRLGIAQAIMENPDLLILDEPFNGLDRTGVENIRQLLLDFRDAGKTILIASHYAEDIDKLCDTVHHMDAGVLSGSRPAEIE